jgi:hypothetical protein
VDALGVDRRRAIGVDRLATTDWRRPTGDDRLATTDHRPAVAAAPLTREVTRRSSPMAV